MDNKRLKEIMKRNGMTQECLACAIGVSTTTLSRKISGNGKGFSTEQAAAVGEALGLTCSELAQVFFAGYDGAGKRVGA